MGKRAPAYSLVPIDTSMHTRGDDTPTRAGRVRAPEPTRAERRAPGPLDERPTMVMPPPPRARAPQLSHSSIPGDDDESTTIARRRPSRSSDPPPVSVTVESTTSMSNTPAPAARGPGTANPALPDMADVWREACVEHSDAVTLTALTTPPRESSVPPRRAHRWRRPTALRPVALLIMLLALVADTSLLVRGATLGVAAAASIGRDMSARVDVALRPDAPAELSSPESGAELPMMPWTDPGLPMDR